MTCTSTCVRPTPSQAHCAAGRCHRTFGSVSAFDRHRRGGECLHPEEVGMQERDGVWRTPLNDRQRARLAALNPDAASALQETRGTAETGSGVPEVGVAISRPAETITGGAEDNGGWNWKRTANGWYSGPDDLSETYPGSGIWE